MFQARVRISNFVLVPFQTRKFILSPSLFGRGGIAYSVQCLCHGLEGPEFGSLLGQKIVSLHNIHTSCGAHPASYAMCTGVIFGDMAAGA